MSVLTRRRSNVVGGALLCLAALMNACGPPESEQISSAYCAVEGAAYGPNEIVQGIRLGDILEHYLGDYSGTLKYDDGETTPFLLRVLARPGEPYHLNNVYQCRARNVYTHLDTNFTTADGVFDHTIVATLGDKFPDAPSGALPRTVLSFSGFTTGRWGPALTARLPIDLTRYGMLDPPYLVIHLDWSSGSTPESGRVVFSGKVGNSDLWNQITVATLTPEAR